MFSIPNVGVLIRKLTFSIEESEEGDTQWLCKTQCRIPLLPYQLACAIPAIPVAQQCFDQEQRPKWKVKEVKFDELPSEKYTVMLKSAPDLETPTAELLLAQVVELRVWRPKKEARDLALEFVLEHELPRGDLRDLSALFLAWQAGRIFVTFTEVQLGMLDDPPLAPTPGHVQ